MPHLPIVSYPAQLFPAPPQPLEMFPGAGAPEEPPLAAMLEEQHSPAAAAFFWQAEGSMPEGQHPASTSAAAPTQEDITFLEPPPKLQSIYNDPDLLQKAFTPAALARIQAQTTPAAAQAPAAAAAVTAVCNTLPFMRGQPHELVLLLGQGQGPALVRGLARLHPALQVALMGCRHLVTVLISLLLRLGGASRQQQEAAVVLLEHLRQQPWHMLRDGRLLEGVQARVVADHSYQGLAGVVRQVRALLAAQSV